MKSIKPGRGPSRMNLLGTIFGMVFVVFWTIGSLKMGAPIFFPLIGILMMIVLIVQAGYHYKNGYTKDRYSIVDITTDEEEIDPFNQKYHQKSSDSQTVKKAYCPYCGAPIGSDYKFCNKCGKQLPR